MSVCLFVCLSPPAALTTRYSLDKDEDGDEDEDKDEDKEEDEDEDEHIKL